MTFSSTSTKSSRIEGFDVARSLAILGMIVVHYLMVMTEGVSPEKWSTFLLYWLDGRAAATFVILAGVGVTLMARKARDPTENVNRETIAANFRRRGWFLLAVGFLNLTIWQGDILRVYGVSLLIAPALIWRCSRTLLVTALGFLFVFGVMFLVVDYSENWDWETMTYHNLWTVSGLMRNLFYDGFRSVFPWTGLLLLGVWLGRLDWSTARIPRRAIGWGLVLVFTSAAVSRFLVRWLSAHAGPDFTEEDITACFGLESMPPLPLFLVNATGFTLLVIGSSILAATRWKNSWLVKNLSATGRLAFTWYVAHIIPGLGVVYVLGWTKVSQVQALLTAVMFFVAAVTISVLWTRYFSHGPMELLLRTVGSWRSRQSAPLK